MNDNNRSHRDRLFIAGQFDNLNVVTNGRWFVLALVAISIASGHYKLAVAFAVLLGLACVAGQMEPIGRQILALVIYGWGIIGAVVLLFIA